MKEETKFNNDEFTFAYPDGIENNFWNYARKKIILNTIKKYTLGNIIDVGCGRGIVTDYLFRNGISIQGIEIGNTTPISNSKAPIMFNSDALEVLNEMKNKFKTISLFDVIEHIQHPTKFMNDLVSCYENVEYLVITVPARNEIWTNFDDYYGHFKRYDLKILQDEMASVGFEIVELRYFFNAIYFAIQISNKLTKKRKIQYHVPMGIMKTINKIIGQLFYWEKFIMPKKFIGSSIICVAKKIK